MKAMWQCGALAHHALTLLNTTTEGLGSEGGGLGEGGGGGGGDDINHNNTPTPLVLVVRLVRQLALVPCACFCEPTVDCLISIFRWLMTATDNNNTNNNNNNNNNTTSNNNGSNNNNNHHPHTAAAAAAVVSVSVTLFIRRLVTTEITALLTHTRRLQLGMFSPARVDQGCLTTPGSYR